MSPSIVSFSTSFICLSAAALQYMHLSSKLVFKRPFFILLSFLAISFHSYVLYRGIDTPLGQNLSLTHLFSLTCWLGSVVILLFSFSKPIENLLVFTLPISAIAILLSLWIPGNAFFQTAQNPPGLIHILISILTFGLLSVATLQAALLYLQNRLLHTQPNSLIIKILPPLETMEAFLFQIISVGFFSLSASLLSAVIFLNDLFLGVHLQKMILSLLAWCLFGGLLFARYQSGLRGLKAIQWTLLSVGLLIGAYLTGKLSFWN